MLLILDGMLRTYKERFSEEKHERIVFLKANVCWQFLSQFGKMTKKTMINDSFCKLLFVSYSARIYIILKTFYNRIALNSELKHFVFYRVFWYIK